jgi:capsule biosynthesis phosphatase
MGQVFPMSQDQNFTEQYKRIVIDVDGTICLEKQAGVSYTDVLPDLKVIETLKAYKNMGFYIILFSSRQMRTHQNNLGKINAETLPNLIEWLRKYDVPYDEIYMGKPWCGFEGFYVDDKAIRPDEFVQLDYDQIKTLLRINEK